jgi:hypothetical protein
MEGGGVSKWMLNGDPGMDIIGISMGKFLLKEEEITMAVQLPGSNFKTGALPGQKTSKKSEESNIIHRRF